MAAQTIVRFKGIRNGDKAPLTVRFNDRDYPFVVGKNQLGTVDWDALAKGPLREHVARRFFVVSSRAVDDEQLPTVKPKQIVEPPKISAEQDLAAKRRIDLLERQLAEANAKLEDARREQTSRPAATVIALLDDAEENEDGEAHEDSHEVVVVPRIDTSKMPARTAIDAIEQATDLTVADLEAITAGEQRRKEPRATVIKAIEDKTLAVMEAVELQAG